MYISVMAVDRGARDLQTSLTECDGGNHCMSNAFHGLHGESYVKALPMKSVAGQE